MTSVGPHDDPELEVDDFDDDDEEMPKVQITRDHAVVLVLFVIGMIGFLYFVLPHLGEQKDTWERLGDGNGWWLAVAFAFQILAMASYVLIFQGVHVPPNSPITYRESYLITMAGLAATRLFAAGGAGGVALTAWALRRSGMKKREVAERMIAFLVLLYGVYAVALIISGVGLRTGIFPGKAPFALTVVPAIICAALVVIFLAIALVPDDLERRLGRFKPKNPRAARLMTRLATGPASLSGGVRFALHKIRHPDAAMIGTVTWWVFNIAVLWAAFKAFGEAPPMAIIVTGYFVGLLGNLLPLPGGIGGVDGGMIGAFAALGVASSLAVVAVLVYRLFAFWLPSIPGAIAYFQLRHTVNGWKEERANTRAAAAPAV